jgi:hypothetical protein
MYDRVRTCPRLLSFAPDRPRQSAWLLFAAVCACALVPNGSRAQTDEIQVYAGEIAAPGEFTLTLHNNYTPSGLQDPAFPGGVVPQHSLNGVPEFAYGATDWLELGLYLPVYTLTGGGHAYTQSAKLRTLLVVPHADTRSFFYGVNFEFSRNARRWEASRYSGEIRPIIGWRFGPVDLVVNPILDTNFKRIKYLDFAPSVRVAYNFSPAWAVALEEYSDFGELRRLLPGSEQGQSLFAVVDYSGKTNVELGVGHGLDGASDKVTVKLMLTWSLHHPQQTPR